MIKKVCDTENNPEQVMGEMNKLSQQICCSNVITSDRGEVLSAVRNENCLLACSENEEVALNSERSQRTGKRDSNVVYGNVENNSSMVEVIVSPEKNCNGNHDQIEKKSNAVTLRTQP